MWKENSAAATTAAARKTTDKDSREESVRTAGEEDERSLPVKKYGGDERERWWGLSLPVKIRRDRKREMAEGVARLPSDPAQCRKREEQVVVSDRIATLPINA